MQSINKTLQLISIQHELAMNVGSDLDLEKMLNAFLQRAHNRLSLSSIAVFYGSADDLVSAQQHTTLQHSICFPMHQFPDDDWLRRQIRLFAKQKSTTYLYLEHNSCDCYLFWIPDFGVLVLERKHQKIDEMILNALLPLLPKLATSCQACVEHQSLLIEVQGRINAEEKLIRQSLLDPLTEIANRKSFNNKLRDALDSTVCEGMFGAIFFIDLDRFKIINDSLGHSVGDQVLKIVAQRFLKCARDGDTVARMGGDEFVLLALNLSDDRNIATESAGKIAQKLSELIAKPMEVEANTLSLSISTGITLFPLSEHAALSIEQQSTSLVRSADLAMYTIKHTNRNGYSFFNKDLQSYSDKRTQIEKHLHDAIKNDEFEVYYQPLVGMDGQLKGAEALLRWRNSELGIISPADFIPIAEESGMILEVGRWVMSQVCKLLGSMADQQSSSFLGYISINVSPRQFLQQNFIDETLSILKNCKVQPEQVRIEITEGVAIGNIALAISKMQQLNGHGIFCMLDDFGSGYSSLSYLHKLPLKTIKIDRSFIIDVDKSRDHQVIIDAIIDICEHFALECIVEGVEHLGEFQYLSSKKITAFQGYYFHKPMPERDFISLLN